MPVLELLLLRLRPNISPQDPTLLANLSTVRSLVHTNSRFYHCTPDSDPSLIYIVGQWPSLTAHQKFLTSGPVKEEILSHQTHQLDFVWMLHIDLPVDGSVEASLPLTAPVMAIERFFIRKPDTHLEPNAHTNTDTGITDHSIPFERILANHHEAIASQTHPHPVLGGWRIDPLQPTQKEYVLFSGWASVEAHREFGLSLSNKAGEADGEYPGGLKDHCGGMEVRHARNMEA